MNNPDGYDILSASTAATITALALWVFLSGRIQDAADAVTLFARL